MPFEEAAAELKEVAKTAEKLMIDLRDLDNQVAELALQDSRETLLKELSAAIDRTPEFQNDVLKERLLTYFAMPERVIIQHNQIKINVDVSSKEKWISAQQVANELRRGGDSKQSPAQRAAYWRYKVYDTEDYEQTIEERYAAMDDTEAAPFWYFLEFGTGPLAYPASAGTFFIRRTGIKIQNIVNYWLEKVAKEYEGECGGILVGEKIAWTKWTQGKSGKWYSFAYDPKTGWRLGGFKARIRETM